MSRVRSMAMLLVVTILLCLIASAALSTQYPQYLFYPDNEKVTISYLFPDGRCRWYVDLWNSGLQQRMQQGQKQVFLHRAVLWGSGWVFGQWDPDRHYENAYPSAYITNLDVSVGRLDQWNPRWRDYNDMNGQWVSATQIGEAKPDHHMYPGLDVIWSTIEIDCMQFE